MAILQLQRCQGAYYLSLNEDAQKAIRDRVKGELPQVDKLARVAAAVDRFARQGDYGQFARFMLSAGEYCSLSGKEITTNYVHEAILIPNIMPDMRKVVTEFYDRLFQFDGLMSLMPQAEKTLKLLGLKPIDDSVLMVTLSSWDRALQRIVYLAKHQKTVCR